MHPLFGKNEDLRARLFLRKFLAKSDLSVLNHTENLIRHVGIEQHAQITSMRML